MGHDIKVHCDYYHQTDQIFQVAKIRKLLFTMERGAELAKGRSLETLDPVVFGMSMNSNVFCDSCELLQSLGN